MITSPEQDVRHFERLNPDRTADPLNLVYRRLLPVERWPEPQTNEEHNKTGRHQEHPQGSRERDREAAWPFERRTGGRFCCHTISLLPACGRLNPSHPDSHSTRPCASRRTVSRSSQRHSERRVP